MRYISLILLLLLTACSNENIHKEYIDNMDGTITINKYKNNKLISAINYDKYDTTKKRGAALYYDSSERLIKKEHHLFGRLVGSYYEYYNSGKPKLYICHDSFGDTMFLRSYDKDANIIKDEGQLFADGISDELYKIDNQQYLTYHFFLATPPYTSYEKESFLINLKTNDTLMPIRNDVIMEWHLKSHFKVTKKGTYKCILAITVTDSSKRKKFRVTNTAEIDIE